MDEELFTVKKLFIYIMLLGTLFVFTACGGDGDDIPRRSDDIPENFVNAGDVYFFAYCDCNVVDLKGDAINEYKAVTADAPEDTVNYDDIVATVKAFVRDHIDKDHTYISCTVRSERWVEIDGRLGYELKMDVKVKDKNGNVNIHMSEDAVTGCVCFIGN